MKKKKLKQISALLEPARCSGAAGEATLAGLVNGLCQLLSQEDKSRM